MQYLNRSRLPVFTPRLDLTAEDLNAQAETICAAINELAGRVHIIKDMIPLEERSQYAEELNYPILDEIQRIWDDIQRAWETIAQNKEECEAHYQDTLEKIAELDERLNNLIQSVRTELLELINQIDDEHDTEEERIENKFDDITSDLERRFNALDDAAARKTELAALLDRIDYIQNNSIPHIGADGYWYIGNIKTDTKATPDTTYTKQEIDTKDANTLQAAKDYADQKVSGAKIWTGTEQDYLADKANIDANYDIVIVTGGN